MTLATGSSGNVDTGWVEAVADSGCGGYNRMLIISVVGHVSCLPKNLFPHQAPECPRSAAGIINISKMDTVGGTYATL